MKKIYLKGESLVKNLHEKQKFSVQYGQECWVDRCAKGY